MTAWLFLGTIPIGVPIIALVGADYVAGAFELTTWTVPVIAAVLLATSLALHRRGVQMAAWAQIFILLLIAGLMVAAILAAGPYVQATHFQPFMPYGWFSVGTSAMEIFWCFVGWEMVGHLAEEFRNPARDLRRTFTVAPALVGILYVVLSVVKVGTHPYGQITGIAPLSQLVGIGLGRTGSTVTGVVALLITVVAIHGNIAGFSRMVYSQARAGIFPAFLGRLHEHYQTSVGALAALVVGFAFVLAIYTTFQVNLDFFIKWPSVVFLTLYGIAMVSAVKLLKDQGWGQRITAFVPLIICIILYPLSGWACIYPVVLALVGIVVGLNHAGKVKPSSRRKTIRDNINSTNRTMYTRCGSAYCDSSHTSNRARAAKVR